MVIVLRAVRWPNRLCRGQAAWAAASEVTPARGSERKREISPFASSSPLFAGSVPPMTGTHSYGGDGHESFTRAAPSAMGSIQPSRPSRLDRLDCRQMSRFSRGQDGSPARSAGRPDPTAHACAVGWRRYCHLARRSHMLAGLSAASLDVLNSTADPRLRSVSSDCAESNSGPVADRANIGFPNVVDSRKASRDDGIDSNVTRGKGIRVHQGRCGEECFHRSAVYGEGLENLREGDGVEFDLGEGPKGPGPRTSGAQRPDRADRPHTDDLCRTVDSEIGQP